MCASCFPTSTPCCQCRRTLRAAWRHLRCAVFPCANATLRCRNTHAPHAPNHPRSMRLEHLDSKAEIISPFLRRCALLLPALPQSPLVPYVRAFQDAKDCIRSAERAHITRRRASSTHRAAQCPKWLVTRPRVLRREKILRAAERRELTYRRIAVVWCHAIAARRPRFQRRRSEISRRQRSRERVRSSACAQERKL
jgi:hypothetical protein